MHLKAVCEGRDYRILVVLRRIMESVSATGGAASTRPPVQSAHGAAHEAARAGDTKTALPKPPDAGTALPERVIAMHAYKQRRNNEISFQQGDIIKVQQRGRGGYMMGSLEDGRTGWFPDGYVRASNMSPKPSEISPETMRRNLKPFMEDEAEAEQLYDTVELNERAGPAADGDEHAAVAGSSSTGEPSAGGATGRRRRLAASQSPVDMAKELTQDFLQSEEAYAAELDQLLCLYVDPLMNAPWVDTKMASLAFVGVRELAAFTGRFAASLRQAFDGGSPGYSDRIGRIFGNAQTELMQLYHRYLHNHPRAVRLLATWVSTTSALREHILSAENVALPKQPAGGAESDHILLYLTRRMTIPLQRLDKYTSYLADAERLSASNDATTATGVSTGGVDSAGSPRGPGASQLAEVLANYTRQNEQLMSMWRLRDAEESVLSCNIDGWDAAAQRSMGDVVLVGKLLMRSAKNSELKERTFLLYPSTLILLSRQSKGDRTVFTLKERIALTDLAVKAAPASASSSGSVGIHAAELSSGRKTFNVEFNSSAERDSWVETVSLQIAGARKAQPILKEAKQEAKSTKSSSSKRPVPEQTTPAGIIRSASAQTKSPLPPPPPILSSKPHMPAPVSPKSSPALLSSATPQVPPASQKPPLLPVEFSNSGASVVVPDVELTAPPASATAAAAGDTSAAKNIGAPASTLAPSDAIWMAPQQSHDSSPPFERRAGDSYHTTMLQHPSPGNAAAPTATPGGDAPGRFSLEELGQRMERMAEEIAQLQQMLQAERAARLALESRLRGMRPSHSDA